MPKKIERRLRDLEIKISPPEAKKLKVVVVYNDDEIPPAEDGDESERLIVRVIKTIVSNREEAAALKDLE